MFAITVAKREITEKIFLDSCQFCLFWAMIGSRSQPLVLLFSKYNNLLIIL